MCDARHLLCLRHALVHPDTVIKRDAPSTGPPGPSPEPLAPRSRFARSSNRRLRSRHTHTITITITTTAVTAVTSSPGTNALFTDTP